jgi:hypothetical protein
MTIMFNRRFVEPILTGKKIHTIRANYDFWKRHDGKECSFRVWQGKPYRSRQVEFAWRVIHVQEVYFTRGVENGFWANPQGGIKDAVIAKNDGFFDVADFRQWFHNPKAGYATGYYAVLHFTDFRY